MIFGVLERAPSARVDRAQFEGALGSVATHGSPAVAYPHAAVALAYVAPFDQPLWKALQPVESDNRRLAAVFTGRLTSVHPSAKPGSRENLTAALLPLYDANGTSLAEKLEGTFAFAVWDLDKQQILLARDHFGIEPLYYYLDAKRLVFGSSVKPIRHYLRAALPLDLAAVGKFLVFNYNPGTATFWSGINKLRPAHTLAVDIRGSQTRRYWKLSFADTLKANEQTCQEQLRAYLDNAVRNSLDDSGNPGVFLSGGLDSSTVLALTSRHTHGKLQTYSYRCRGQSFDESHYARLMAQSVQSSHHEVEYTPDDVLCMTDLVKYMNEPFCDTGINIATHILGKQARENVQYVLTGDGGDELFGGHPVYEADKIAALVDPIPSFLKRPLLNLASYLPDSDRKKSFVVKVKRFAESLSYPADLRSHRWRVYYHQHELRQLLTDSAYGLIESQNLYEDVLKYNKEADGNDVLSQSLYSDYQTAVDFYLRRNDLNRQFRLEARFPLLDRELVEYCAKLPATMKIRGWFDTKYIFKKAMEAALPRQIVYRKDKLGHSIPMKNWMRDNRQVKEFVLDHLSASIIRRRGYFNPSYVSRLVDDHMRKKRNNAHRLWTLAVLEMWLREHADR